MKKNFAFILFIFSGTISAFCQEAMTLGKAMDIALRNSPVLIQSKIALQQNRLNLKAQQSLLKSQFSLDLNPFNYNRSYIYDSRTAEWFTSESMNSSGTFGISQPIKWTDGTVSLVNTLSWQKASNTSSDISNTSFRNNLGIRIDQPIFTYNKTKMRLKELEYSLETAKLNYVIQQLSVEKRVTASFYDVYQKQQQWHIAKEEYRNQQQNYEIIKNKVEAGLIPREELFQAEVNLASSESALYSGQINYDNIRDNFKLLLGLPLDAEIVVLPDTSVDSIRIDPDKAVREGLRQRLEIRNREISIERGVFDLVRAKAENEFKGNISAEFGISGLSDKFNKIYDNSTNNQNIGLKLTVPIWDWGAKKARVKSSELGMQSDKINLEEEKKSIALNIRQLCRNLPVLEKQLRIAQKNIENAQRTYEINTEKYRNGSLTGIQLQQYQTQLTQKKQAYINAIISYKLELLDLKIQSLWDFSNGTSYLEEKLKIISVDSSL